MSPFALVLSTVAAAGIGVASSSADEAFVLSPETTISTTHGGGAAKGKLVRMIYGIGGGQYEKVLVSVYADATGPDVWNYSGAQHAARDIYMTRSTDDGITWSAPVNLSLTASSTSITADHDGDPDTDPIPYHGDSEKPNIFSNGKNVVVSWVDAYCPTTEQRTVRYPESGNLEVPYKAVYVTRSTDGGLTWSAAQRLTDGYRDAKQDVNRGSSAGWMITWQADPQGLQPGDAEGPGDGGSGAKVSKGTDIWRTQLPMTDFAAGVPFPAADRITDNFTMMGQGQNEGYEYGNVGASRANLFLIGGTAVVAYEETKGLEGLDDGKYVRYHVFSAFNDSLPDATAGQGWIISKPDENARRVRLVAQGTGGPNTNVRMCIFFKQGEYDQGGPSDIIARTAIGGVLPEHLWPPVDPRCVERDAAFNNALGLNVSSSEGLDSGTNDNSFEDARAHRAVIDGDFIAIGYSWTPDWAVARFTDLENYNFYLRRSFDGGQTWDDATNLSNLTDPTITVKEPRLLKTPGSPDPSDTRNPNVLLVAWGTEVNQYEHQTDGAIELDLFMTRTANRGETWADTQPFAADPERHEYESQLRLTPEGDKVFAVWQNRDADGFASTHYRGGVADPLVAGDVNGDGLVDVADLIALLANWGICDSACMADFDHDGDVDVDDLQFLLGAWTT